MKRGQFIGHYVLLFPIQVSNVLADENWPKYFLFIIYFFSIKQNQLNISIQIVFMSIFNNSLSMVLRDVILGRPGYQDPWRFYSRAYQAILFAGFRRVCPIYFDFLLPIWHVICSSFNRQWRFILVFSLGQNIPHFIPRHLLIKPWSFWPIFLYISHISLPYRSVNFTYALNIQS